MPFDLLIDDSLLVSRIYGALKPEGNRIQRTVYLIGKNGKVLFKAQGAPEPNELLAVVRKAQDT